MGDKIKKTIVILTVLASVYSQKNNGDHKPKNNQIVDQLNQTTSVKPVNQGILEEKNNQSQGNQDPVSSTGETSTIVPSAIHGINDTSCTTWMGEVGECVPYYLCISSEIDSANSEGSPCSSLDICCLLKDKLTPPKPDDKTPKREGCGWRNPQGVGMVIPGGDDEYTKFGEFPWMVAVLENESVNETNPDDQKANVYVGGGSLIHPSIVLTTAHSVTDAKYLRVRAGEWDTQTTREIYPYQHRDVEKIVAHKDFNKGNLFYDVALLFLSKPMDLAPNVGVVCLPPPSLSSDQPAPGTRCFAAGWGKDKFGRKGRYQTILKKVDVPVVPHSDCQEALRKTRLGSLFQLHSSFMCAGGEPGRDICKSDSGSPLVCPIEFEKDRFVQTGIVAWGIGCGEDGTPGVYVDVANLRSWIDDKVKGQGYDIIGYSYTF